MIAEIFAAVYEDDIESLAATLKHFEDNTEFLFTILYISIHPQVMDGGLMRHACRQGKRNIILYLISKLSFFPQRSTWWNTLWTLGILENGKDATVRFWFQLAPSMNIMDDLYKLTANVVLHMFKMSQSKYFLSWLQDTDISYLDHLYMTSSFNPYRSFQDQRTSMQKVLEAAEKPFKLPITARKINLTAASK